MASRGEVFEPTIAVGPTRAKNAFSDVLDEKAWELLGVTGEEFRRLWYAGAYRGDSRTAVLALDRFMRTGVWYTHGPDGLRVS